MNTKKCPSCEQIPDFVAEVAKTETVQCPLCEMFSVREEWV